MKTRYKILIISIVIITILFLIFLSIPQCWNDHIGGGAIDLDPDLSPSYACGFASGFVVALFYHTILPLAGLCLGISALFLVPYFIAKRKNIPSRPYLALILAAMLLFFTIPIFVLSLGFIPYFISHPEQIRPHVFGRIFLSTGMPAIVLVIAGILLYRSSVIRNFLVRRKKNED